MTTHTIRLHRVLRSTPEKVYRAFIDADAMSRWLPPHGFIGKVHHMDAKVGGTFKMSFTNFTTGKSHAFGGSYLELVPQERIRYTEQVRRSQPPRGNASNRDPEESILWHRGEHRARGSAGRHSGRGVLPRLAGIALPVEDARRARPSQLIGATCPSRW